MFVLICRLYLISIYLYVYICYACICFASPEVRVCSSCACRIWMCYLCLSHCHRILACTAIPCIWCMLYCILDLYLCACQCYIIFSIFKWTRRCVGDVLSSYVGLLLGICRCCCFSCAFPNVPVPSARLLVCIPFFLAAYSVQCSHIGMYPWHMHAPYWFLCVMFMFCSFYFLNSFASLHVFTYCVCICVVFVLRLPIVSAILTSDSHSDVDSHFDLVNSFACCIRIVCCNCALCVLACMCSMNVFCVPWYRALVCLVVVVIGAFYVREVASRIRLSTYVSVSFVIRAWCTWAHVCVAFVLTDSPYAVQVLFFIIVCSSDLLCISTLIRIRSLFH